MVSDWKGKHRANAHCTAVTNDVDKHFAKVCWFKHKQKRWLEFGICWLLNWKFGRIFIGNICLRKLLVLRVKLCGAFEGVLDVAIDWAFWDFLKMNENEKHGLIVKALNWTLGSFWKALNKSSHEYRSNLRYLQKQFIRKVSIQESLNWTKPIWLLNVRNLHPTTVDRHLTHDVSTSKVN